MPRTYTRSVPTVRELSVEEKEYLARLDAEIVQAKAKLSGLQRARRKLKAREYKLNYMMVYNQLPVVKKRKKDDPRNKTYYKRPEVKLRNKLRQAGLPWLQVQIALLEAGYI